MGYPVKGLIKLNNLLLCVADYAAYRNEMTGSYFIQQFCDMMRSRAHQEHFVDIITQVTFPSVFTVTGNLTNIFISSQHCGAVPSMVLV